MAGEVPNEEGWRIEVVGTGALEFGNSSDEDKAVSSEAILVRNEDRSKIELRGIAFRMPFLIFLCAALTKKST